MSCECTSAEIRMLIMKVLTQVDVNANELSRQGEQQGQSHGVELGVGALADAGSVLHVSRALEQPVDSIHGHRVLFVAQPNVADGETSKAFCQRQHSLWLPSALQRTQRTHLSFLEEALENDQAFDGRRVRLLAGINATRHELMLQDSWSGARKNGV